MSILEHITNSIKQAKVGPSTVGATKKMRVIRFVT